VEKVDRCPSRSAGAAPTRVSTFDIAFRILLPEQTEEEPVSRCLPAALIVLAATIETVMSVAMAQTPPPLAAPFNPSFGDVMHTLVQPRHAQLGLIGREQNWTLAAYESHQLKDALSNIARWRPRLAVS
jgi:hypothetical protein